MPHNVADRSSYGSVEQDTSGLQSGEVDAHGLSRLKRSHNSPQIKL